MKNQKIKELQCALETASALADIIQDDYEDDVRALDGYNDELVEKLFKLEARVKELEARNEQILNDYFVLEKLSIAQDERIKSFREEIALITDRNAQLEAFVAKCADLEPVEHYLDKLGV